MKPWLVACFLACSAAVAQQAPRPIERDIHEIDPGLRAILDSANLQQYEIPRGKPCPDQWKAFENAIRLERQEAVDRGASYYIAPESQEELVRLVLGNPYVEPLRIDHAVPVVDDELSIWVTHNSAQATAPQQIWSIGYRDPLNRPGQQFTRAVSSLGSAYGLFTLEVRYRNLEAPDHHVYVTIGGPGMCSGNASCGSEIRSWDGTNRTLRQAAVWRSVLKVPTCSQLALDPIARTKEWYFEPPSTANPAGLKQYPPAQRP